MSIRIKNNEDLISKFEKLQMDWYSIYNWVPINRIQYMDDIADIICDNFDQIENSHIGLRDNKPFNVGHDGTCRLNTSITQITEKRICRALFNHKDLGVLGNAIDYEVPFKEYQESKQGDIDLLSHDKFNNIFIIEAKKPDNNSILKAILQAFSYSLLVQFRREKFFKEFQFEENGLITPSILVFENSECGKELRELNQIGKHPELKKLLLRINEDSIKKGVEKLRFFTIMNKEIEGCLIKEYFDFDGCPRIIFQKDFLPFIEEVHYDF